jgi:hypothetical protein
MIKQKRGEVFGMSFNMIFSIIIIVFFLVAAFYGIKAILNYNEKIQLNLFQKDLQNEIDEAWHSERTLLTFNSTLPSKVDYVCLVDFASLPKNATSTEISLYDNLKQSGYDSKTNLYLYSQKAGTIKSGTLSHIDLKNKNPVCFRLINNKVSMKIEKKTDNPLVIVRY